LSEKLIANVVSILSSNAIMSAAVMNAQKMFSHLFCGKMDKIHERMAIINSNLSKGFKYLKKRHKWKTDPMMSIIFLQMYIACSDSVSHIEQNLKRKKFFEVLETHRELATVFKNIAYPYIEHLIIETKEFPKRFFLSDENTIFTEIKFRLAVK
jgi:hypothetical protein